VGGEFPPEFEAVGVPVAERGSRADEAIGVVRRLWTEDRVAHEKASSLLGMVYARDFREASKKYCLLGRPEDCLEQLRSFARAGCRHFILAPLSDPAAFAERAATEILPGLRSFTTG